MLFLILLLAVIVMSLLPSRRQNEGRNPSGFDLFYLRGTTRRPDCESLWGCDVVFARMLRALDGARRSVRLEMYIFDDDSLGRCFERALSACLKRGVDVAIVCDGYGCRWSRMTLLRRLQGEGAEVRISGGRFDRRNHRKMLIVDEMVAFVGGANIARRYVRGWYDMALVVRGDGVAELVELFESDRCNLPYCCRLASGGVNVLTERELPMLYESLLRSAKDRIVVVSPYFVPPTTLFKELIEAHKRGVVVEVMLPMQSDSRWVQRASESFVERLLVADVAVWHYQAGFNHAKFLVIDDVVVVGSANFDYRSLSRNLEVMIAFSSSELSAEFAEEFSQMSLKSHRLTREEWSHRPFWRKLSEKMSQPLHRLL